jgi:hypothetical protein
VGAVLLDHLGQLRAQPPRLVGAGLGLPLAHLRKERGLGGCRSRIDPKHGLPAKRQIMEWPIQRTQTIALGHPHWMRS